MDLSHWVLLLTGIYTLLLILTHLWKNVVVPLRDRMRQKKQRRRGKKIRMARQDDDEEEGA